MPNAYTATQMRTGPAESLACEPAEEVAAAIELTSVKCSARAGSHVEEKHSPGWSIHVYLKICSRRFQTAGAVPS